MCVDGESAYVSTETWQRSDGESCECTLDYAVQCSSGPDLE